MEIREATAADAGRLATVFYAGVHGIAREYYLPEQLRAWAPVVPDPETWAERMPSRTTLVAECNGSIAAFGELEADGHIDRFYCHPSFQRRGIGTRLLRTLEQTARERGLPRLSVEASLPARRLFEAQGFRVLRQQQVERRGVALTNFAMEKRLG